MSEVQIEAVGARLRQLRLAEGYTSAGEWAKHASVERATTWTNYEAGRRLISPYEAARICELTGVTLDWIYRSLEHTLPLHVRDRLKPARAMANS